MPGTIPDHLTDRYGLALTTESASAAENYRAGLDLQLEYGLPPEPKLVAALQADEDFALAYAALVVISQFRGRIDEARQYAAQAQAVALRRPLTRREQQHIQAISLVAAGETNQALALIREHLAEFPRDALLLFLANSLFMNSGWLDRHQQNLALIEQVAKAYGDDWWFLGLRSFIYHELNRFSESRTLSERSLALNPHNANAVHNLAHVFVETAELETGLNFLRSWLADYPAEGFFYCHLGWHQALFELYQGNPEQALALFEAAIRGNLQSRSALPDGASLLWRLQLYGYRSTAELPWEAAHELAERLAPKPGFAFNDAHVALIYAATQNQADLENLRAGLRALGAKGNTLAGEVVLPLAEGLAAFGGGDYVEAIRLIEPLQPQIVRLGGSQAQREIFEDTLVVAYLRAGVNQPVYQAKAGEILQRRLARRKLARDVNWLKQIT